MYFLYDDSYNTTEMQLGDHKLQKIYSTKLYGIGHLHICSLNVFQKQATGASLLSNIGGFCWSNKQQSS